MLRSIDAPLVAADEHGRIMYANAGVEALLGWRPGDLEGCPLTTLMPERYRERHRRGFDHYVETGESRLLARPIRVPARHAQGHEVLVDLTIHPIGDGTAAVFATMRDASTDPDPGALRIV